MSCGNDSEGRNFLESLTLEIEQEEKHDSSWWCYSGVRDQGRRNMCVSKISVCTFNQTLISKLPFRIPEADMPPFPR